MPRIILVLVMATSALITTQPGRAEETAATDDLKPGDVLNESNWKKAEGLLPPEILKHYQNGDYANPIVDWPAEQWEWPPDFLASSEKNAGQFDVDDAGTIIEKGSGKQPPYILGLPFPSHRPRRSQGGRESAVELLLSPAGTSAPFTPSRSSIGWRPRISNGASDVIADFEYYDGVPEAERLPNPENFSTRFLAVTVVAGGSQRHRVAELALPRPEHARLDLGVCARPAPRTCGESGQPIGRVSRLGHEPGRRRVLRRQDRGLHLDAER